MPLATRRRRLRRRPIETIDDEDGPPQAATALAIPFLLGGVVAVGSMLALFYMDSLSGDRTSMIAPPLPGQTASAAG